MGNYVDSKYISPEDFAVIFSEEQGLYASFCDRYYQREDFCYRLPDKQERDDILLLVFQSLDSELKKSGSGRISDWKKGWQENYDEYCKDANNLAALIPYYFRSNKPQRLFGDYIIPQSEYFAWNIMVMLSRWVMWRYLCDCSVVYEFGCGTGHNLARFAQMFPEKKYRGFDWAPVSGAILAEISKHWSWDIAGCEYDFFNPPHDLEIEDNSAFITCSALEQVGSDYCRFLDFVLKSAPALVVNIEAFNEFYDQNKLTGYLGLEYQLKRNYLRGYLTALRKLAAEGRIEIIKEAYCQFGNTFFDGASYVVWKPL